MNLFSIKSSQTTCVFLQVNLDVKKVPQICDLIVSLFLNLHHDSSGIYTLLNLLADEIVTPLQVVYSFLRLLTFLTDLIMETFIACVVCTMTCVL